MFIKSLFYYLLRLLGWKFELINPLPPTYVMVAVPHTSNWDAFLAMAVLHLMRKEVNIAIKKEMMFFPLGILLKNVGFIPVDRSCHANHFSNQMIEKFKSNPNFIMLIAPEGTRKAAKNWKTGFYYIAKGANVPIVMAKVNFAKKYIEIGKIIKPTEIDYDMREIMNYCKDAVALRPENFKLDERYDH